MFSFLFLSFFMGMGRYTCASFKNLPERGCAGGGGEGVGWGAYPNNQNTEKQAERAMPPQYYLICPYFLQCIYQETYQTSQLPLEGRHYRFQADTLTYK